MPQSLGPDAHPADRLGGLATLRSATARLIRTFVWWFDLAASGRAALERSSGEMDILTCIKRIPVARLKLLAAPPWVRTLGAPRA